MSCKCDTINIINEEHKIIVAEDTNIIVVSHADGRDGKNAYQQAVEGGYTGTEQEFNCSLSLLADVAEGKRQIADAINTKGGTSTPDESFQQLAEDIQSLPYAGISAEGIVQTEEFSFLEYITSGNNDKISEINDSEIYTISKDQAFYSNIALREVVMSGLTSITASSVFAKCTNLERVFFPEIISINGTLCFSDCTNLQVLEFPKIQIVNCAYLLQNVPYIRNIVFGKLTSIASLILHDNRKTMLRNITIGQDTDINLPFQQWSATNVINEGQSGIDELNSNLYNNLLTKLYDHSNDGETRTLRLGWLAHVTQENIDYANSKGWTLTT